jgi:hypothetical protein
MHIKENFITVNQALTDLVDDIKPEHLGLVPPAYARYREGQTLRDSLNALAYENLCVPKVLAGESGLVANSDFSDDLLGDNYIKNYLRLSAEANDSVRNHPDMESVAHVTYADYDAKAYLTDITLNRALALYDIAAMTGLQANLPGNVIQALYVIASQYADVLRQMHVFPAEIQVSEQASAEDEFLALAGRQPKDPAVVVDNPNS